MNDIPAPPETEPTAEVEARATSQEMAAADLPMGDPLDLTPEQRAVCGKDLATLIERRIAFHHSGLSYGARAGVIEPLAKAGIERDQVVIHAAVQSLPR